MSGSYSFPTMGVVTLIWRLECYVEKQWILIEHVTETPRFHPDGFDNFCPTQGFEKDGTPTISNKWAL